MSVSSHLELLGNSAARRHFHHPSAVSTLDYTNIPGLGLDHASYCTSVAVPSAGDSISAVLAVGTYAEACFAFELHQAFLAAANASAVRIPETRVSMLRFSRGEAKKPYRIGTVRGIDKTQVDGVVGPDAAAIAASGPARRLVWCHFDTMNLITAGQRDSIPTKKGDVTPALKALYVSQGEGAARAYYKFRHALVEFIRARHVTQRRALGRAVFDEFSVRRGGRAVAAPPAVTPPPLPGAAVLGLQQLPSPLTGPLFRRLQQRLTLTPPPSPGTRPIGQLPSPLTEPLARRLEHLLLAASPVAGETQLHPLPSQGGACDGHSGRIVAV